MNVEEMYQQIILDHYREKHHSGLREGYDAEVTQVTSRSSWTTTGRSITAVCVRAMTPR